MILCFPSAAGLAYSANLVYPSDMQVRKETQSLVDYFKSSPAEQIPEDIIQVSSATRKIAFAYERFRNTLEPDEEEILRRNSILRILERRLFEDRPTTVTALTLLQELIRGNYVKNVPKSMAEKIGRQLKKVKMIYAALSPVHGDWFLRLVAVAIDHELFNPRRQEALVHLMYHDTYKRLVWGDEFIEEKDRPTQFYLGCHRALFAADNGELTYHYFVHRFPVWGKEEMNAAEVHSVAQGIPSFRAYIESALDHPARDRVTRLLRPVAVPYVLLRDLLEENGENAFESDEIFESMTQDIFNERARRVRERMNKRAWHSILFLFFTKTLLALFIEVPYEAYLLKKVHYLALAANITFHPLLLFVLATAVRMPGQKNSERAIDQLKKIVSGEGELPTVVITAPRHYGATTWSVFAMFYAILFMIIFWGLFSVLDRLEFSLLAMFFFVIFLGLVSFLATRIRRSVDDLRVIAKGESAFSALTSFFALPILEFGRWLAQNIRQINILLFFMDRVLEAPFKILIDITEEWFDFVRDRREEIVK